MIRSLFAAAVVTLAAGAMPAYAQNGGDIIGRAAQAYRALNSLRADFVQVIDNPMVDSAETRGTLTQAGEAKFAMRFSEPAGDAIVIDGEHIWLYTPSTTPGQVLRLRLPNGGPVYGYNMLAWFLDRPAERYRATFLRTERVNNRMADVVELLPNVPDLPFTRAVLWLDRDDALPRRLEIQDQSGSMRRLTLSKLRINERISDKTFKVDLPANTRIVDQ